MANRSSRSARELKGILSNLTGSIDALRFTKKGVLSSTSQPISIKRPGQYTKKMGKVLNPFKKE